MGDSGLVNRVTAEEIARRCGVSRGTVDRALHNRGNVSEQTRQKVLRTAETLGYRPHPVAQSLVLGRTLTIGLVTLDLRNSFVSELVSHCEMYARRHGYFTYVTNTDNDPEVEKDCVSHLVERAVDGIIIQSVHPTNEYADWLSRLRVPVVAVGNRLSPNVPFVGIDDRTAASEAVRHARERGYDQVVFVCPPLRHVGSENIDAQEQRYLGYLDHTRKGGLFDGEPIVLTSRDVSGVVEIARAALPRRTVFFCSSDVFALDALSFLIDSGLTVPEEVGVIGFDNISTLRYIRPRLTTVDQKVEQISHTAVDCLLSLIKGENVLPQTQCPHRLIHGETT